MASEWKYITATEYCGKVTDGTHDSPKRKEHGRPLITSKHIKGHSIDFESAYLIGDEDFYKVNLRSKVEQWNVLISMIGEYCGYCYVEKNASINYAVKNLGIFKTNDEIRAKWLYYYLDSPEGRATLKSLRSGTSQPYLSLGVLRSLPIRVTSNKETMNEIVSILSALDDKIELNRQMNETLEQMAKAIFKEWFVNFNYPGATGKMQQSELGEIPEGWKVIKLGEILDIKYGKDHKKLGIGSVPVYGSGGVIRYADTPLFTEESILIPRKGSLNNVFFINKPFWAVDTMFYSIIKDELYGRYLYLLLSSMNLATMNVGTAVPSMTTEVLNKIDVVIPPRKIMETFDQSLRATMGCADSFNDERDNLMNLRDALLPKLMNGEIEV